MNSWRIVASGALVAGALLWPTSVATHNPVTTTVLFNREIATLFSQKCLQCHATGKLAMPLETFEQARPWAQSIKEEVLSRQMPPWPAQRGFGVFANDVGLTTRELDFLISWIDGGTPEGTEPAPPHVDHSAHWMLGTPSRIARAAQPVTIAARSAPQVRRVLIDPGNTADVWLRGFDYKPGDARVVRAAFVSIADTDQFIGGWTPWATTTSFSTGSAVRIARGARLAVDILYQSAAESVTDRPEIGLYFIPRATREVRTLTITPGASALTLARDLELLSVRLDAGSGARSVELRAKLPDGAMVPLLRVKQLQPEWQTPFVLAKPVTLPKGTTVQAVVRYADGAAAADRRLTVSINSQPPAF